MNMTPNEIMDGLKKKNLLLSQKNSELSNLTESAAGAERAYSISYAQTITRLKIDGHPATLIPKLAAGDEVVADLKYKMDIANGVVMACRESIKDIRASIDSYRSILTWLREELHNG
jgi:hypothetical protein